MIELAILPPAAQAALVVIAVLVEAVVFYFGYGAIEQSVGPSVIETIESA